MDAFKIVDTYTMDDIYALPDGERAELIDGKIYYMAPPSRTHQRIVLSLSRKIADYIESKNGECEINIAPFAVFLNKDDINYIEPDISIVCDSSKLDDKGCHGAPDWIIEIVSPGTSSHDYVRKLKLYLDAGVREYWIVDLQSKKIFVYFLEQTDFRVETFTFHDSIKVNIYEDLSVNMSELDI